jgi:hypothetical protein
MRKVLDVLLILVVMEICSFLLRHAVDWLPK